MKNLVLDIEEQKSEVERLRQWMSDAWANPGHPVGMWFWACAYHARFEQWAAAREKLRLMEKQREVYP